MAAAESKRTLDDTLNKASPVYIAKWSSSRDCCVSGRPGRGTGTGHLFTRRQKSKLLRVAFHKPQREVEVEWREGENGRSAGGKNQSPSQHLLNGSFKTNAPKGDDHTGQRDLFRRFVWLAEGLVVSRQGKEEEADGLSALSKRRNTVQQRTFAIEWDGGNGVKTGRLPHVRDMGWG
jgi:hypothetical protein